jgi:hypothetical protein
MDLRDQAGPLGGACVGLRQVTGWEGLGFWSQMPCGLGETVTCSELGS